MPHHFPQAANLQLRIRWLKLGIMLDQITDEDVQIDRFDLDLTPRHATVGKQISNQVIERRAVGTDPLQVMQRLWVVLEGRLESLEQKSRVHRHGPQRSAQIV